MIPVPTEEQLLACVRGEHRCGCECHRIPGVMHVMPCCGEPPLAPPERYSGDAPCPAHPECTKTVREHPQDPDYPWPTFVLLCDGTHAKV